MSDLAMGKIPYLEQRGGRWYFRMRVPDDVANAFGKTEIRKSLKTGCYKTAKLDCLPKSGPVNQLVSYPRTRS